MTRIDEIKKFIKHEINKNILIESNQRYDYLKEKISEVIEIYKPSVIIKIGIGSGRLLNDIITHNKNKYIVVVEPSIESAKNFLDKNASSKLLENVKIIIGEYNDFPVDYYKSDLLINVDYFDFIETTKALHEFKRAMEFESHIFLATFILHENDVDGIFDDLMKMIFPLHNDYYLENDLKTIMELNEFTFIKGDKVTFELNLTELIEFFKNDYDINLDEIDNYINQNKSILTSLYGYNNGLVKLPYYSGFFMKNKPA